MGQGLDFGRPAGRLRVSAILAASYRVWRRDLRSLTLLAAALEAPLVVAEVAHQVSPGLRTITDESFTFSTAALVVVIYGSLSHHFLAGLLERVVGSERRGERRPRMGEILHGLPWRRLVVADLLLTAVIAAGLAFFVVPGLIALTWFCVTLPIVNLERRPVLASFVRSYRLVRGHSWRVFGMAMCVLVVPEMAIGAIAGLAHHLTDDAIVRAIAHGIPAIVLMPIAALPVVVLAFDLVELDELDARERPAAPGP